jgi:hypothetical protein
MVAGTKIDFSDADDMQLVLHSISLIDLNDDHTT